MNTLLNIILALILALFLAPAATAGESAAGKNKTIEQTESAILPDGVYLVIREAADREKLEPVEENEHILVKDDRFLEPADRGDVSYLVVNKNDFVPIVLANDPNREKDAQGKPKLLLQLADEQIKPLEEFTTRNCGKGVAVVIGKNIVTCHKIREPIKGGNMQITRCTDSGCDAIYTQLQKKTQ